MAEAGLPGAEARAAKRSSVASVRCRQSAARGSPPRAAAGHVSRSKQTVRPSSGTSSPTRRPVHDLGADHDDKRVSTTAKKRSRVRPRSPRLHRHPATRRLTHHPPHYPAPPGAAAGVAEVILGLGASSFWDLWLQGPQWQVTCRSPVHRIVGRARAAPRTTLTPSADRHRPSASTRAHRTRVVGYGVAYGAGRASRERSVRG